MKLPKLRAGHVVRVVVVLSAAGFWAVVLKLFGAHAALFGAAAWFVALSVRDLTTVRVRAVTGDAPLTWATWRWPVTIDVVAALLRLPLLLLAAFAFGRVPGGESIAEMLCTLLPCVLLWPRETLLRIASHHGVAGATTMASLLRNLAGLSSLGVLAQFGTAPEIAVPVALMLREAVAIMVLLMATGLGRWAGLRLTEGFDDEDGADVVDIIAGSSGGTVTPLRRLVLDNLVWSRWKLMQYATRQAAGSMLGPVGNLVTRIGFAFQTPRAAADNRSFGRKHWFAVGGGAVTVALIVGVGSHYGLLPALGLTSVAYACRFAGLGANFGVWGALARAGVR